MRWVWLGLVLVLASVPAAWGQLYGTVPQSTGGTGAQAGAFPKVVYTADKSYEADLTWEPHRMLTDQKIMFIFQFYSYNTGELVPMVDYDFVVSQDGHELARIPGTTSQAGDYKYFAFDRPGPVTITLDKIGDTDSSASFNATVYPNPHPSGPVTIVQPAPNISNRQRAIFPVIEDVAVGGIIVGMLWLARGPILRKLRV